MKTWRRHSAALVVLALGGLSGCGYTLVGKTSTLPASIRVIHFQTLANQTTRVGLEQRLSSEIARELASRGRFSVKANPAGADAELTGAVKSFDLFAIAFDDSGRAKEYQVRVTASVSLKTLPDEKVLWENQSFTFQDNYALATSAASYVDRENEVIDSVGEKFAASLVSSLLEGF